MPSEVVRQEIVLIDKCPQSETRPREIHGDLRTNRSQSHCHNVQIDASRIPVQKASSMTCQFLADIQNRQSNLLSLFCHVELQQVRSLAAIGSPSAYVFANLHHIHIQNKC